MVRRALAAGAALIALLVVVFGFKSCVDSRKESAITDYVTDVDALVKESNAQGEAVFQQLEGGDGGSDVDVQVALDSYAIESAQLVDRARGLDQPGDLDAAQGYLVETLQFRNEGIDKIAEELPNALAEGDSQEGAAKAIAQAMQRFLASDQIYFARVLPQIDGVLRKEGISQPVEQGEFLTDLDWLQPAEVASRLGGIESGASDEEAAPGLHGNGLGTVTLGGQALVAGGSSTVTASGDLAFEVQVLNQGENTETDVTVRVTVGEGGDAIELDGVIDEIAAGETQTVELPLNETPPTGQAVPISVEIELVPGEDESVGNNAGEFSVIFTS
jgi:hypothetical protein